MNDDDYRFKLLLRGYRLKDGHVWWIENDDPDNLAEYRVGPWQGTHLEAWKALDRLNWPRREAWSEVHV